MHLKKTDLYILTIALFCFSGVKAQVYLNPFTQYGLGEMLQPTQVNRLGMGGTAYTETDPNRYNFANPASYSLINYFSFELGASGNLYNYKNDNVDFKNIDVRVPYLSIAFPLKPALAWGFSAGLMPYSRVGYDIESEDTSLNNIHKSVFQTGSGGLTRFYMGSSIRLFPNFYAGANAGYIFGNTQSTVTQTFPDTGTFYGVHQTTSNVTGGFLFDAGFVYNINFKLKYKRDKVLNDSFVELQNQEVAQQRALPKPISPSKKLERQYLRLDMQYEKSRDSLHAIKLTKEEQKAKLSTLKTEYKANKKAIKNSVPSDSFQAYEARMKDYKKALKDITVQFNAKKEVLKKNKKVTYDAGLKDCEAKTKIYQDSIKILVSSDTAKKYKPLIRKYRLAIRKLRKEHLALERAAKRDETNKVVPQLNKINTTIATYEDSLHRAEKPKKQYDYLYNSSKQICTNYLDYRNYTLQLGGTVNLPTYLPTTQSVSSYSFSNVLALSDSLSNFTKVNGSIYMPMGMGGSVELRCENNWKVGLTAEYRQWSKFQNVGSEQQTLNDYYSLGIGGQWTPIKRQVNNNVFTTANYKMGFRYSQTPYIVNGNAVNDMRLSLGLGLAIPQNVRVLNSLLEMAPKNWHYVDIAIEMGQTGSLSTNLIQQQYIMLSLGLHVFEVNWFLPRKLE